MLGHRLTWQDMARITPVPAHGPWADGEWRVSWLTRVRHATCANDVAPRLLELEAALRPAALRASWWGLLGRGAVHTLQHVLIPC